MEILKLTGGAQEDCSLSDSSGYSSSTDYGRRSRLTQSGQNNNNSLYSLDDSQSQARGNISKTETVSEKCKRLNIPVEQCPNSPCPLRTYSNILKFHLEACPYIPVRKGTVRGCLYVKMMGNKFKPFINSYEAKKGLVFLYRKTQANKVEIVCQKYGQADPVYYSFTLYDRKDKHIFKQLHAKSGKIIFIPQFVFEELGNKVKFKITVPK